MSEKKLPELKDLDADLTSEQDTRAYLRDIPKSAVKPEHYHLMYLLEQRVTHFLDGEVTELQDCFQINYHLHENVVTYDAIKTLSKNEKLRYLLNIAKLEELQHTRYTYVLEPKELHFTKNGLPLLKTRGIRNVIEPLPYTEKEFLTRYKALIIEAFNDKVQFESLVEGNLDLYKGTPFDQQIIQASNLQDLKAVLQRHYNQQEENYKHHYAYVQKKRYALYKWASIGTAILSAILLVCLAYLYFFVMKHDAQVDAGYKSFIKEYYTQVLNDYENVDAKRLDKEALFAYAKSYVETNKQGLEKEKKNNVLNHITPSANKDYLLYWVVLGQGDIDEALNISTYLEDNDLTKLALINKLNDIKNNPKLSSEKRSEQTKKYNDRLQDILDKEKEIKDEKSKEQEASAKQNDERLKQQEENEKKQKEQAQEDRKKRQEAERKN
ncbi:type VII secretion protein EssB [Staphylococcus hyicus]|uniref:type VII secretion protein EssB n=1 Tax=Staphylococcus hyicus TaxID=1284 RepID=UPI00057EF936|nr:type VII secretion protein EssB [Staphylococcus hyicus]AJC97011.1 type VII secretion protein EssB [Staphylococcus hyicus]RTX70275.1 type VII secretion protein EssB [Staphylococcus hyicus]SQE49352.1 essB [Staphylococcus hyicus]